MQEGICVIYKHLIPTRIPHRFISKTNKTTTSEEIKKEFVDHSSGTLKYEVGSRKLTSFPLKNQSMIAKGR